MRVLMVLVLTLSVSGCSGLLLHDDDTAGQKAGKVATRTVLGLASLGISEMVIATEASRERRDAEFAAWWRAASPAERAAYQRRQAEMALMLAPAVLGNMNWGRPPQRSTPSYQGPRPTPSVDCTTRALGDVLRTYCY